MIYAIVLPNQRIKGSLTPPPEKIPHICDTHNKCLKCLQDRKNITSYQESAIDFEREDQAWLLIPVNYVTNLSSPKDIIAEKKEKIKDGIYLLSAEGVEVKQGRIRENDDVWIDLSDVGEKYFYKSGNSLYRTILRIVNPQVEATEQQERQDESDLVDEYLKPQVEAKEEESETKREQILRDRITDLTNEIVRLNEELNDLGVNAPSTEEGESQEELWEEMTLYFLERVGNHVEENVVIQLLKSRYIIKRREI